MKPKMPAMTPTAKMRLDLPPEVGLVRDGTTVLAPVVAVLSGEVIGVL